MKYQMSVIKSLKTKLANGYVSGMPTIDFVDVAEEDLEKIVKEKGRFKNAEIADKVWKSIQAMTPASNQMRLPSKAKKIGEFAGGIRRI